MIDIICIWVCKALGASVVAFVLAGLLWEMAGRIRWGWSFGWAFRKVTRREVLDMYRAVSERDRLRAELAEADGAKAAAGEVAVADA